MKKIITAILVALAVCGSAFAGKDTFEAGACYGSIVMVDKNNSSSKTVNSGWGFKLGSYNDLVSIIGTQTNLFFYFPKTLDFNYGNTTIPGSALGLSTPFAFSGDLMLMLRAPLGILELKAGAGIGYTVRLVKDRGSDYSNHYIGIPVSASAQLNFGPNVYLNAGCDVQFGFFAWKAEGSQVNELTATDNFVIIPHVSLGMKF